MGPTTVFTFTLFFVEFLPTIFHRKQVNSFIKISQRDIKNMRIFLKIFQCRSPQTEVNISGVGVTVGIN